MKSASLPLPGDLRRLAAVAGILVVLTAPPTLAQKQGGILREYMTDSPASMSIHEESTVFAERPVMGVFNNLVLFDQHVKQNNPDAIVPELATGWSWSEDDKLTDCSHLKPLDVWDVQEVITD